MKNFALICLMIAMLAACRKDLVGWQSVERFELAAIEDRLNNIYFINEKVGFIVGGQRFQRGVILRTADGGKTWNLQPTAFADKAIMGICSAPNGYLYAIGFDGKLLKSEDEGISWKLHQLWYLPYKDIAMFDDHRGLAIGGISFYAGYKTTITSNGSFGGFDSLIYELNDLEMIDGKTGFLAGYGTISKTEDSGKTWQMLDVENDNFTSVHVFEKEEIWTSGYNGSIFRSSDGGNNWERMRNGNDLTKPKYRLLDIVFQDTQHGYAVGEDGLIIYTDDGGNHWLQMENFTSSTFRSVIVTSDGNLLVCGDNGSLYKLRPRRF